MYEFDRCGGQHIVSLTDMYSRVLQDIQSYRSKWKWEEKTCTQSGVNVISEKKTYIEKQESNGWEIMVALQWIVSFSVLEIGNVMRNIQN
jgi:hypothetical protein